MMELVSHANAVIEEVGKAVVGKHDVIEKIMMAVIPKGHILVEDIPGVGKTTMALSFSRAMGLKEKRVQFTPDVLPADLTGFTIYQQDIDQFVYQPGAVMCNFLLADEINRTSPKTQSALLEVMEEHQVTVDGITRKTGNPFIVLATENPEGSAGTQLLPESQSDVQKVAVQSDNLREITRFAPSEDGQIEVTLSDKPTQKVYHRLEIGGNYTVERWEPMPFNDDMSGVYRQFPESLSRLRKLCEGHEGTTAEEMSVFIQKEFTAQTVYDYSPGAVPEGQDFAEYFLFENKRGF